MTGLFFYGTLVHLPLLECVLGRRLDEGAAQSATMADHAIYKVQGQIYPGIAARTGVNAKGVFIPGLGPQDIARLDFYAGGFGYRLRAVQVETANGPKMAEVWFPSQPDGTSDAPWGLEEWRKNRAELAVIAAREAMGYFGQIDAQQLAARFPAIRRRADSYLRGCADSGPKAIGSDLTRGDVMVKTHSIPYSNFFSMQEYALRFRKFDGEMSDTLDRATFVGFDVALVLPYDPARDQILLVEQFRLGPYARGAENPWVLEPIAGHIDVGETPKEAARRETAEEAGLELGALLPIANAYPSPGCSTEYYHIFLGLCDLGGQTLATTGLASENEDIRSHILSYQTLMEFVDSGEANNQPLILAAHWLARNRERLRAGA